MENKFKVSLLTASVVMGLSLPAVGATGATTTPAPASNSSFTITPDTTGALSDAEVTKFGKKFDSAFNVPAGGVDTAKSQLAALAESISAIDTAKKTLLSTEAGKTAYDTYLDNQAKLAVQDLAVKALTATTGTAKTDLLGTVDIKPTVTADTLFPAVAALDFSTSTTFATALADPLKLGGVAVSADTKPADKYGAYVFAVNKYAAAVDTYYAELKKDPAIKSKPGKDGRSPTVIAGDIDKAIKVLGYQYRQNVLIDTAKNIKSVNQGKIDAFFNAVDAITKGVTPAAEGTEKPAKGTNAEELAKMKAYVARLALDAKAKWQAAGSDPKKLNDLFTTDTGAVAKLTAYIGTGGDGASFATGETADAKALSSAVTAFNNVLTYYKKVVASAATNQTSAATAITALGSAANTTLGTLNTALSSTTATGEQKMAAIRTALGTLLIDLRTLAGGDVPSTATQNAENAVRQEKSVLDDSKEALILANHNWQDLTGRLTDAQKEIATLQAAVTAAKTSNSNITTIDAYLNGDKKAGFTTAISNLKSSVDTINTEVLNAEPFASLGKTYQSAISAADATAEQKQAALNSLIASAKALVYGIPANSTASTTAVTNPLLDLSKANLALGKLNLSAAGVPQSSSDDLRHDVDFARTALNGTDEAGTGGAIKAYNDARQAYLDAKAASEAKPADEALKLALNTAENDLLQKGAGLKDDGSALEVPANITALTDATTKQLYTAEQLNKLEDATKRLAAFTRLENAKKDYSGALTSLANSQSQAEQALQMIATVLPFSTATEQTAAQTQYNEILSLVSNGLTTKADQKTFATGEQNQGKTLYLGALTAEAMGKLDANGDLPMLVVQKGADGKVTNNSHFDETMLYTGEKAQPLKNTVLSISAPLIATTGALDGSNKITVGGTTASNMLEVFASTYAHDVTAADTLNSRQKDVPASAITTQQSGAAVRLGGNLFLKEVTDGTKVFAGISHAVDSIELQNTSISNVAGNGDLLGQGTLKDPDSTGLLIDSKTVNAQVDVAPATAEAGGKVFAPKTATTAPQAANIVLKNVNIDVKNSISSDKVTGKAIGIDLKGSGNHIMMTGDHIITTATAAANDSVIGNAIALRISGDNNIYDLTNFKITGDIVDMRHLFKTDGKREVAVDTSIPSTPLDQNVINLNGGTLTGDIVSAQSLGLAPNYLAVNLGAGVWTGSSRNSSDFNFLGDRIWNLTADSSANYLRVAGSNLINLVEPGKLGRLPAGGLGMQKAHTLTVEKDLIATDAKAVTTLRISAYNPDARERSTNIPGAADNYDFGKLAVDNLLYTEVNGAVTQDPVKFDLQMVSSGAEPVYAVETYTDVATGKVYRTEGVTNALDQSPTDFISYNTKGIRGGVEVSSKVQIVGNGLAEQGVWQYKATEEQQSANRTGIYYTRTGQLSNSAATVAGLAAAPASVAAIEGNALGKHITSLRHSEGSGVWISYYGGSNQNTLDAGPQYKLKTNGVMLGVDTAFADWMAGIAFTSGKASLSVLNSSGNVNNYGAQFWLSRHYSNGVFVDGVAQFGHYANKAKVSMLDGTPARGEYASNGYGLSAKVGYAYQQASGFYAEPYVQASARAFSGAAYKLDNGMSITSTDYKSFVGEIGTDLGYTVPTGAGYFKPYLHLAVLNEFASSNSVRANNVDLQNSINGAALRIGVGGEVKLMQNLGGYLSYDYTKGSNTERPWQVNLGVNYTW